MKKVISLLVAAIMLMLSLSVFADSDVSSEMQAVLLTVKSRVDIPEELSEFSSYVSERAEEKSYTFEWSDKKHAKSISVSCDAEGRISSYYNYSFELSDKKLSNVSKQQVIDYAHEFLRKTLPEAFEDSSDSLVYDDSSYNARGNLRYSLEFDRYKNFVPVKDNYASIMLCVSDEKIHVRNMTANFEYDAEFEEEKEIIPDYIQKYTEAFPAELVYCDEYNYEKISADEPSAKPVLIYRIKDNNAGYISMTTGEVITEDSDYGLFREENAVMDTAATGGSSSQKEMLTEQEIAELSQIEGLMSQAELEKALKALPYMNFTDSLKLTSSNLTKNDRGEYLYRLHYNSEDKTNYRYLSAVVNAQNGKILSISQSSAHDAAADVTLTEKQKKAAEEKMLSFLNTVAADELKTTEKTSSECYSTYMNNSYVRIVNGIKYVDNGIDIAFDAKNNVVTSYRMDFRDGDFADVASAIEIGAAYEKILEYAPVTQMYILSGGKYVKAATLEKHGVTIDALSGEIRNRYETDNASFSYSDINGHWVEEAATKLSEIQVGIDGGALNPESHITQEEFFRLICSGMINKYYNSYTQDELYDSLIFDKIIEDADKAPDSSITREDAFIYIIRIAGLEKVAKLTDIYKIQYTDGSTLENGNLGYAAILSGLGVICGDGGYLRPQDNLSRAEAVIMLYRYLLTL